MKQKIQIDLCELFGVKEGQEFVFVERFQHLKYKIENNKLLYANNDRSSGSWWVSENSIGWLTSIKEIEILKPKMPEDVRKALEGIQTMGCHSILKSISGTAWYAVGEEREILIMPDPTLFTWLEENSDRRICYIANLLKEFESKKRNQNW